MSKKKVDVVPKQKVLGDKDEDVKALLVSLGLTPVQVDALVAVASGEAPADEMVRAGFWAEISLRFENVDSLTADDLVRAGFSTVLAQFLFPPEVSVS
jgi:hypothetical protein